MQIDVHPLVPDPVLPTNAPASTRSEVPRGYRVQEQCLPFTAAASAGLLIRPPFSFGFCAPDAPARASRLAALLVGQMLPAFSLLAPCDPGAAAPDYVTVFVKRST